MSRRMSDDDALYTVLAIVVSALISVGVVVAGWIYMAGLF